MAACAVALAAAAAIAAASLASGSKTGTALALIAAASPVVLYLALARPFMFPFGLYAFLVPFNHLVVIPGLGTLTKLAGIVSSVALLFAIMRWKRVVAPSTLVFAWLAFVTWACASTAWAINPNDSLPLISTLAQLFLLFVATAITPLTRAELRFVLTAIAIGGVAAAAYGAKLFMSGNETVGNRLFIESANAGEYLDPNHFSAALLLPLALVLMAALSAPTLLRKLLPLAGVGVLMLGVYASGSRGGLIAIAAIVLFMLWRTRYRAQLIFITVAAAIASLAVKSAVWSRFLTDLESGSGRSSIWTIGAHAYWRHPIVGAGIGNFPDAYNQALLQYYTPLFTHWDRPAHNLILMVGVELGAVGLALLVWLIASQFRVLLHIRPGDELYDVRVALEAAVVGLLVASLSLDILYWKYAWLMLTALAITRSASIEPVSVRGAASSVAPRVTLSPTAARRRRFEAPAYPVGRDL